MRFFITPNGLGGGHGHTLQDALYQYALALRFMGIRWAYRGRPQ